jgi:hypothetical protein
MTPDKKRRLTNALGFLSGGIACMDAVREQGIFWPPADLWMGLRTVQRVELGGGILLIVVIIVRIL